MSILWIRKLLHMDLSEDFTFEFIFFYLMDVALVNSHIIYQNLNGNLNLLDSENCLTGKHSFVKELSSRFFQLKESL